MLARMSSPPQRTRFTLWIALALTLCTQIRLWPAWSGWHKDDDFKNLRWALAYRDTPWKALTELTPVHEHIRPATLWGHWLGAHLGDGSWAGIHAVHVLLCTGTVIGLFLLTERLWGWKEGIFAAGAFLLLPGIGELPWWNAWMCSAGEVSLGLFGLWRLQADLEKKRWPIVPFAALALAGLFKEPGWVLYPLAALALAFQQLRVRPNATSWVALLGFPVLGVAGLALSYHPENLERSGEGLEFAQALGALVDPMVLNAPNAGAGIAFPLPLLALGLLSRLGARGWPLWVGTAAAWGIGVGLAFLEFSPGWLLVVGVPLALALATRQWARGAAPPVDLLLLFAGLAIMAPFSFPHPVQMLGGLAGLCMAMAAGWMRLETGPLRGTILVLGLVAIVASWGRQEQPIDGEFPSPVSAQAKVQVLDGLALAQSRGVTHAKLLENPDDRAVVLALGGLEELQNEPEILFEGLAMSAGKPLPNLLGDRVIPRTNLRHKASPGAHPLLELEPGRYFLSVHGAPEQSWGPKHRGAQRQGPWLELLGDCGTSSLTPAAHASEHILALHVETPCTLELRADTRAPSDIRLSSAPEPTLSYRAADPSSQQHFFETP